MNVICLCWVHNFTRIAHCAKKQKFDVLCDSLYLLCIFILNKCDTFDSKSKFDETRKYIEGSIFE